MPPFRAGYTFVAINLVLIDCRKAPSLSHHAERVETLPDAGYWWQCLGS